MKHLSGIILMLGIIGGLNLYIGVYNLWLWVQNDMGLNLLGIVNLLLGVFAGIGFLRLRKKRENLKKEQQIFE